MGTQESFASKIQFLSKYGYIILLSWQIGIRTILRCWNLKGCKNPAVVPLSWEESEISGESMQPRYKPHASFGRKCPSRSGALMPRLPLEQDKIETLSGAQRTKSISTMRALFPPKAALLMAEGPKSQRDPCSLNLRMTYFWVFIALISSLAL